MNETAPLNVDAFPIRNLDVPVRVSIWPVVPIWVNWSRIKLPEENPDPPMVIVLLLASVAVPTFSQKEIPLPLGLLTIIFPLNVVAPP